MNQYWYVKKFKEFHLFFNLKTFLGALPQPQGHPPHCDNDVLPNLMKYSDFPDRALIYREYQTHEKFWWRQMMNRRIFLYI